MTDSNIFGRNPRNINASYGALEADLYQIRHDAELQKARENASLEAASLNQNLPFSVNGQVTSPEQMLQYLIADIERNPNSISVNYVRSQLIQNPLVRELDKQGMLPAKDIEDLAQKISQRTVAKANNRAVYNPEFGDVAPEDLVREANRPDAGFLERTWESTRDILGFTGRGETEAEIAEIDKQLSRYPTSFKLSFKKLQEIEKAKMELENLQKLLHSATDSASINQLHQRIAMQNERIATMQSHITEQDQANIQQYGQSFLQDWRKREGLKAREDLLTPRYSTTVQHERDIAEVNRKHLNMGHSASFSDPDSWTNGYVKDYMLTYADPDVLAKEIAPEVLPWVGLNFLIDAGAAALTGGASLPTSIAKWATMIGMGANSAYQAIDKNIDQYFEQHGTTAGFSELQSYIMEGIGFAFDMYGGHILGHGLPSSVDKLFKSTKKEAMQSISKNLDIGRRMAEATGSVEPFKAAVKNAYQVLTGSSLIHKIGDALVESGTKAAALQGKGKIKQALGTIIKGTEKPLPYLGRVGVEPLYSATKDAALSLAAENMMSETARQVGRQNGMNADTIIESGLKGLVAGPIGRVGGKALSVGVEAKQRFDKFSASNKDLLTDQQLEGYTHHIDDAIKLDDLDYKKELYTDIKRHINGLDSKLNEEELEENNKTRIDNVVEKYQQLVPNLEKGKLTDIWVNSKGEEVKENTPNAIKIKAPKVDIPNVSDSTEAVQASAKNLQKDLQKEYKRAFNESKYKDVRQAQKSKLQELLKRLEEEGNLKQQADFIAGTKSKKEVEKEEAKKDVGHMDLANKTAREIDQGKKLSEYADVSAEDLMRLNSIKDKSVTRDVVDRFKGRSEEERQQLHNAIVKGDIANINKLLTPKEEDKAKEAQPLFTQKDLDTYKKNIENNKVDLEHLSESNLRDLGIIKPEESIDMDKLQSEMDLLTDSEAVSMRKADKEAKRLRDSNEDTEGRDIYPELESVPEATEVSDRTKEIKKAIDEYNAKIDEKDVKGTKEVSTLSKEIRDELETTQIGGKETVTKVKDNKYATLNEIADTESFWESDKVTQKDKDDIVALAREEVKIPLLHSDRAAIKKEIEEAGSIEELITALHKINGLNVQNFLSGIAHNLYTKAENKRKALQRQVIEKGVRYKSNTIHSYAGYSERAIIHHYLRTQEEEQPQTKEFKDKCKQYDASFLFNKDILNNDDYLNFVAFVCRHQIFGETLDSAEKLEEASKRRKPETQLKALRELLETRLLHKVEGGLAITTTKLAQLDLLISSLYSRANSGVNPNFKILGDYLNTIKEGIEILIERKQITEDITQTTGLWTGSSKFAAKQEFASESAREYRTKYLTANDYINYNYTLLSLMNKIDPSKHKDRENYAQIWSIEEATFKAESDSDEVQDAITSWLNSHHVDRDTELQKLFDSKKDEVFKKITEYWIRDVRANSKKSSSIINQLFFNTKDEKLKRFFSFNEGKASDVGSPEYWKQKWEAASPNLRGRIIDAFISNPLTLATLLGIKPNKHITLKTDVTTYNRIKQDLYAQIQKDKVDDLCKGMNQYLKAYICLKLKETGFINTVTLKNLVREEFQKDLKNSLEQRIQIRNTIEDVELDNNGQAETWYKFDKYIINYHTDWEAFNRDLEKNKKEKLTKEEIDKLNEYNEWKLDRQTDTYNALRAAKDPLFERGGEIYEEFHKYGGVTGKGDSTPKAPTGGKYKGKYWNDISREWSEKWKKQWYAEYDKDHPKPDVESIFQKAEKLKADNASKQRINKEDYNVLYYKKRGTKEWIKGTVEGDQIKDTNGTVIASKTAKNLTEYSSEKLLETVIASIDTAKFTQLPATENKAKRPAVAFTGDYAEQMRNFFYSHYGQLVVYKWLSENDFANVTTAVEQQNWLQQFSNVFSYLNVKYPKYNARKLVSPANVTYKDLNHLIDVIQSSKVELSKKALMKIIEANKKTNTGDMEAVVNKYYDGDKLDYSAEVESTEAQRTLLAQSIQYFINNNNNINNSTTGGRNNISFSASREGTLSELMHNKSGLDKDYFKKKSRKSILLHEDGYANAVMQNPDLADNEAFQAMVKAAESLYGKVQIPSSTFAQAECDAAGTVLQHTIDVAVAAGVSTFARTSSETSEDFLNQLRISAPGAYRVYSNPNNHIIDQNNFIDTVGKMAAKVLGYNPKHAAYGEAVARLGQLAVLGLAKADIGFERVYINRFSGNVIPESSNDKANCIPAIRITKPLTQTELADALKSKDSDGIVRNWADKLLDVDFNSDDSNHTKEVRLKQDMRKFASEYHIETGKEESDWFDEDGNVKVDNLEKVEGSVYNFKGKDVAKIIRLDDMALVCLYNKVGKIDPKNLVVFTHDAIEKTDYTAVSDTKLVTLAAQIVQGVDVNLDELFKTFEAMGILKKTNEGNYEFADGISEEEVNSWDLDQLENFLKDKPFLQMMLYTNSKYGMNPHKRSGKDWLNTRMTNLLDFRKMVKDIASFQNIDGKNYFDRKTNKDKFLNLYFSEMNTVNNRLFVKSAVFNYREFKHWRSITSVNRIRDKLIKLETKNQQAMFAAPILFNLGFDVDKIADAEAILDIWNKLVATKPFQELLTKVNNATGYDEILKAIEVYNKSLLPKSEATTYISYKGAPKAKNFEIGTNYEAVTTLSKMKDIIQSDTNESILKEPAKLSNLNVSVKGYDITIEVDGLTNGPSFKNIGSPLISNTDFQSHFLLGATGASNIFFNIREAYEGGVLDTYNLNGQFVKDSLTADVIREFFRGSTETSDVMTYLSVLYKPSAKEKEGHLEPPTFMDSLPAVMAEIFDRNFMKPPTMVIGYEAGKVSVIQTLLAELDRRFSNDCANGDRDELHEWFKAVQSLIGKTDITAEYVVGTQVKQITITSDGMVNLPEGAATHISQLTKEQMQRLSISHTDIPGLRDHLSNLFGKLYDAIAAKKELVQKPYQQLGECAQALATAYDTVIKNAINYIIPDGKDGIPSAEYLSTVDKIIDKVQKDINAIIHVGVEGKGDKSLLSLTKEEVRDSVLKAMSIYTTAGENRYVKSTVALAGRVSLGAGTVPMFIHSYDSSVVHVMLQKVMDIADERILTIHDALLANLTQLAGEWNIDGKTVTPKDGVLLMNQGHYESGHEQLRSFADICQCLHNAINAIESKKIEFGLEGDSVTTLTNMLKNKQEMMFKTVASLASQRRAFYTRERELARAGKVREMWHDYQYSNFGDAESKEALGGFVPTADQLTGYINAIDSIMAQINFPPALTSIKYKLTSILKEYLTKDQLNNVFGNDGEFNQDALSHLTTYVDFHKWLVDTSNLTEEQSSNIKSVLAKAVGDSFRNDPETRIRNTLIQSLKQSESATPPSNADKGVNTVTSFLQRAIGLLGDRSKHFGPEAPTRLLLSDDNNTLHNRAIEAVYALSKLPSYLRDNSEVGQLIGLREMTHLHKESPEQSEAFIRLITPLYQKGINVSSYDVSKTSTVVYSDSFDYVQLEKNFRNAVNKQHYLGGEKGKDFTYYKALSSWYSGLKKDMEKLVKASKAGTQFVFTLRSNGDIFRMLALQDVLNTGEYANQGFTIATVPAVSNLSQASAAVDEEVAVYQKLMNDNPNLNATYFTGTIFSHNVQLQQAIMGINLTSSAFEAGVKEARTNTMLVMDTDKYATAKQVKTSSLSRNNFKIYRKDEINVDIPARSPYLSQAYDTDLATSPIHGQEKYGYNVRTPYDRSFEPAKHYSMVTMGELGNSVNVVEAVDGFDEVLGNDDSTVIVQTEASGRILHQGLAAYAEAEGTTIHAAYLKYKEQQAKKWQRWEDSNHTEYEWKVYLTPIVVSVPNHLRQNKVFVFMPAVDNSVTIEQLRDGILQKSMENNYSPRIVVGSELSNRLNRVNDKATIDTLEELRKKYKNRTGNYRVVIPKELMPKDQLWEGSLFNPSWLKANNATYLKEVYDRCNLGSKLTRIPVDSAIPYTNEDNAGISIAIPKLAKGNFLDNARYVNLANVPLKYYSQIINAQKQIQAEDIESRVGELTKDSLISFVGKLGDKTHSYLGKIPLVNKFTHGYVGTVKDIPAGYDWRLSDDILAYDQADSKFRELMLRSIERDKAKGVDTSLVEQNLDLMDNLVTLAYVRIGQTRGIQSSLQTTLLAGEIGEREFLNIGTTGAYESEAEAFMHEMLHTLWRHLNAGNPGLRKKLSDMYNYVSANFNINYFEDGNTLRNQQTMDAVFSKDTVDNVEEFLCYYLTNRAFHNAVNNMANQKGTKLSEVLESNTRGIFRKLLNSAQNILAGKLGLEKEPDTIEGLAQKALSVALNYNNKYWLKKQNLIESATKEEIDAAMILGLKEPAYKVLDKLYDDSVFTKAVQGVVQKLYKALGFGNEQARYMSANIGATEEFNRITETGWQLSDNLIEAKRDYLNAEDNFMNDLLSSLEGVSRSQYDYLILRTKSKAVIDQQREQLGSAVNEAVREVLKNVPEKIAKHLTMQFIHTDMSCLFRNTDLNLSQIRKVLTDKETRDKHIKALERTFASDRYANYYKNAAKGLAQYLVTGFNPTGLNYRNAYEILSKAGSQAQTTIEVGSPLHNTLDQLITLYTIDLLDTSKVNVFKDVPIETLNKLAVIHNAVKDSDNKEVYFNNSAMHLHVPKGELHGGVTNNRYEIIPEEELQAYEWNGYKKVSDAELDPFFKSHTNGKFVMVKASYKSPAVTTAGIFTMTNIFKGRTQTGINIGSILGKSIDSQTSKQFRSTKEFIDLRNYIQTRIENLNSSNPAYIKNPTSGNMLLNFNIANHLAGATFEVNPIEKLKQTGRDVKVTSVLGDLYGSVVERTLTPKRNTVIAQAVSDIYENAEDKQNFVWIAPNSENEKYRDLYDHLPVEVKELAREKYKDRGLPVRLKALNTVFGYANLSANDTKAFIEAERKARGNAQQLGNQFSVCARNIFYNKYLGNAETFVRWLAKVGKTQVVIKGITTSWFNVLSNCVLLSMNGLSAKQVLEYQLDGLRQFDLLRQYKYQLRLLKQKQIFGQYTDADARAEASIDKSIKSLPIYDLIDNGVIANTIAEDRNESEAFMQNVIRTVFPKGLPQTIANNLAITPNSALYQILADFASLGDIGGKWAFYRYNRERKMDKKEAARLSLNAFIDYSNPLPKQLQLVDDFAVLPFMKYALGIQNMLIRTMAKHPDRTLGWILGVDSLIGVTHPFQSLLTPESMFDRMQLPGELFADSFGSLPSNRLINWYGDVNP